MRSIFLVSDLTGIECADSDGIRVAKSFGPVYVATWIVGSVDNRPFIGLNLWVFGRRSVFMFLSGHS